VDELALAATVWVRIFAAVLLLPYLSASVLGGAMPLAAVTFLIALGMLPAVGAADAPALNWSSIAMEAGIGSLIGLSLSLPFWVANHVGHIIDNQRGATMSSTMDPAIGVDVSSFSTFMTYFWAAVFMLGGGARELMEVLAESYRLVPVGQFPDSGAHWIAFCARLIGDSVGKALIVAAPAVVMMLVADVVLAVASRFAPQLNAFSLALSVKSVVAVLTLMLYLLADAPHRLMPLTDEAMRASPVGQHGTKN